MGRTCTNGAVNRAVAMVASGSKARAAWDACGQPNGEKAIQNIRQRGLKRRHEAEAQQPEEPEPTLKPEPEPVVKKKQRKVYANARQARAQRTSEGREPVTCHWHALGHL